MPICEKCGYEYRRKYCECCVRISRLHKFLPDIIQNTFSKRIIKELGPWDELERQETLKGSLFITGPVGSGKTLHAANLLIHSVRENLITNSGPVSHLFVSMPKLLNRIKKTYNENSEETEGQIIDELIQTDFLVLDDLGAERVNDWVLQILYLIINERYEDLKLTIFTSNLNLKKLEEALGNDRIPSRINAMCEIVNFGDKDLRVKNKNG